MFSRALTTSSGSLRNVPRRRGVALVIAMLFVVLFSVLALGFFSSVTTSTRIASNERSRSTAYMAAESGVQFLNHHLAASSNITGADTTAYFDDLVSKLSTRLNNTTNMTDADTNAIRNPAATPTFADGATNDDVWIKKRFFIPGYTQSGTTTNPATYSPRFMRLGTTSDMGQASIIITLESRKNGTNPRTQAITVAVAGRSGTSTNPIYRALEYDLKAVTTGTGGGAWQAPMGSIVTYSQVSFSGGGVIINANITALPALNTTAALSMGGGGNKINGTFTYPTANNTALIGHTSNGNSVSSIARTATIPPKPLLDATVFQAFVPSATAPALTVSGSGGSYYNSVIGPSTNVGSANTYTNIRVKSRGTSTVTFGNNCVFNGVIYVEAGTKFSIGGGAKVNGVIIQEDTTAMTGTGTSANNQVILNNGVVFKGAGSYTATGLPSSEISKLATLATMSPGPMVVAPESFVNFSGGLSMQNSSAIVGKQIQFDNIGTATAFSGVILQLGNAEFKCAGGIGLNSGSGSTTFPGLVNAGSSSRSFAYDRATYEEISPAVYGLVTP